mmetsp:Transcript_7942/g.18738  ORF Transcript_7942/g.18738 Transcript_7942/m.18738 type:complete len:285 (+) Transcript_7942:140-994(+)
MWARLGASMDINAKSTIAGLGGCGSIAAKRRHLHRAQAFASCSTSKPTTGLTCSKQGGAFVGASKSSMRLERCSKSATASRLLPTASYANPRKRHLESRATLVYACKTTSVSGVESGSSDKVVKSAFTKSANLTPSAGFTTFLLSLLFSSVTFSSFCRVIKSKMTFRSILLQHAFSRAYASSLFQLSVSVAPPPESISDPIVCAALLKALLISPYFSMTLVLSISTRPSTVILFSACVASAVATACLTFSLGICTGLPRKVMSALSITSSALNWTCSSPPKPRW